MLKTCENWYELLSPPAAGVNGNIRILKNLQFDLVGQTSPAGEAHISAQLSRLRLMVKELLGVMLHAEARRTYQPDGKSGQYRRTVYISQVDEAVDLSKLSAEIKTTFNVYTKISVPCPVKK